MAVTIVGGMLLAQSVAAQPGPGRPSAAAEQPLAGQQRGAVRQPVAEAQTAAEVRALSGRLLAAANESFECSVSMLGTPRRDSFLSGWVVAFAAAGPDCDSAQAALGEQGAAVGIQFMRRPNLGQLRALLGPMIRSAELASGCRISVRGQPVLDEATARWFVHVTGAGAGDNCAAAVRDLSRQAGDIDVTVLGSAQRSLLNQIR